MASQLGGLPPPVRALPLLNETHPARDRPAPAPRRFLALPAEEVAFLRNILALHLSRTRIEEVLRMFGRRLGRSMAGLEPDAPEVGEEVCRLVAQVGIAKATLVDGPLEDGAPFATDWVLLLERVAEPLPAERPPAAPVFTAGYLEGLFEGLLGTRVLAELRPRGEDRWELRVGLVTSRGPSARGPVPYRLPAARAYRLEVGEGEEFFDVVAPFVAPGSTLIVTREHPRRLRTEFGFTGVEIRWFAVTRHPQEAVLPPGQMGRVAEAVESFLAEQTEPSLVLWQGLDYLANRHPPEQVERLVDVVVERTLAAGATIVIEVPRDHLDANLLQRLRRVLGHAFPNRPD